MTIKIDSKEVTRSLTRWEKFLDYPPSEIIDEIGNFSTFKIQERTANSKDVNKRAFKPYSKKYKKFRENAGRPVARVDLFFTGKMLASMTYTRKGKDKIILFFQGAEQSRKAFYNNNLREFFGLNKTDLKQIKKIYLDGIKEG